MKIVFMGTPDFAARALEALIDAGHEITAVVTQPDKPQGRKQVLVAPPVKEKALELGIPVFQHTVQNTVLLCLRTELGKVFILHGKHFQLLAGSEHIGKSCLAFGFRLVSQYGIEQLRNFLCSGTGDLCRHLSAFQSHSHDLFRRIS